MNHVNTYSCGLNEVIMRGLRRDVDKYLRERQLMRMKLVRQRKKLEKLEIMIDMKDKEIENYRKQIEYYKKFNPFFEYQVKLIEGKVNKIKDD